MVKRLEIDDFLDIFHGPLGDQLNFTCRTITNKMRYDAMNGYWIYMDTYGWPDALVRRSRQPGTTNTVQRISQLVYQMCINDQKKLFHCT